MKIIQRNLVLVTFSILCAVWLLAPSANATHIEFEWVDQNTIQGSPGTFIREGNHPDIPFTLNGEGGCPRLTFRNQSNLEQGTYVANCDTLEEHTVNVSTSAHTPPDPGDAPPIIDDEEDENEEDDGTPEDNGNCPAEHVEVSVSIGGTNCIPMGSNVEDNAIVTYLVGIVRFLAVGAGLVITFTIIVGGIEYITSSGNPQKVEHAKKRLRESVEALVLFIFMAAILNYVIPGGIIGL